MTPVDLSRIAAQLQSSQARDRLQALTQLRSVPADTAVPLIKTVLYDVNLPVRSLAIYTLAENPNPDCYAILVDLLAHDADYAARADAAAALGALADIRALEPLTTAFLEDDSWLVKFSAAVSLGNLHDPRASDILRQALTRPEAVIQMAAIAALGEIGDVDSIDLLLNFVSSEDWLIRQRLANALGNLPSPKSIAALRYLQKDAQFQVAQAADFALMQLQSGETST
jgi:HEAT repeat protein